MIKLSDQTDIFTDQFCSMIVNSICQGLANCGIYSRTLLLGTKNCLNQMPIDCVSFYMMDSLKQYGITYKIISRGFIEIILFIDEKNKIIYTVMSKERFEDVRSSSKNHYAQILSYILNPEPPQKTIEDFLYDNPEEFENNYNRLFKSIPEGCRYHIILFEKSKSYQLLSASIISIDKMLNTTGHLPLSDFIMPDILMSGDDVLDMAPHTDANLEDLIKIKEYEKQSNASI